MIFDHLNAPPISTKEKFGKWRDLMSIAAKHKNFYAKISGLGTASGDYKNRKADDIKPYMQYKGEVAYTSENYYTSLMNRKTLYNKRCKLVIDDVQKIILYGKNRAPNVKHDIYSFANIDSVMLLMTKNTEVQYLAVNQSDARTLWGTLKLLLQ